MIQTALIILLASDFLLLGGGRLGTAVKMMALQGFLLALITLLTGAPGPACWLLAAATLTVKGVVFPAILRKILRNAKANREIQPYVGYNLSLLLAVGLFAAALLISMKLPAPQANKALFTPTAFFTVLGGLFLITARRTAIMQVIGYLIMENGIYLFGLSLAQETPFIVELGLFLDIFAAVFIMAIVVFHINREFDHMDMERLAELKDWSPHD